mgnify:CR=1 FL=1
MMLLRSAQPSDLESIYLLAAQAGITTLPPEHDFLAKRIAISQSSFRAAKKPPFNAYYFFVLEHCPRDQAKQIVGVCGIEGRAGAEVPFYSFTCTHSRWTCETLNLDNNYQFLQLSNDNSEKTELCTLYLQPEFRYNGHGLLLSRARLLFLANFPERFNDAVIAEIRGVSYKNGRVPFWEYVGKNFFHIPFKKADKLCMITNKQFIRDLLPPIPIYVNLLPKAAQSVIGKPHAASAPAMHILEREGFKPNHTIDIFDGGPTIEAPLNHIKTVQQNKLVTIRAIVDKLSHTTKQSRMPWLLANTHLEFRATMSAIILDEPNRSIIIDNDTAKCLAVEEKQNLRIIPLLEGKQ